MKHGAEQVQIWRRSFDIPPPVLEKAPVVERKVISRDDLVIFGFVS